MDNTPPLSVQAGSLTRRAETVPVRFWVSGRPSGEISFKLSIPAENMTPPEYSGEILYVSHENQWLLECQRKPEKPAEALPLKK